MQFPVNITEIHHRGDVLEWTIDDETHLQNVIEAAQVDSDYDEFHQEKDDEEKYTIESYIEWLRQDCQKVIAIANGEAI